MKDRSPITTHVLDTNRGRPGAQIAVTLEFRTGANDWKVLGKGTTNSDGRVEDLLPKGALLNLGVYRLTFQTGEYFAAQGSKTFYPYATIAFEVASQNEHYHVPLLLSGHGYSTYRGS